MQTGVVDEYREERGFLRRQQQRRQYRRTGTEGGLFRRQRLGGQYRRRCQWRHLHRAEGDSLSKIAKQHLGDANAWKKIFEANRDVLDDPDKIFPGQTLKLPPK